MAVALYGSHPYSGIMTKAARLDMRLEAADDLLIRRAAEVSGTSVSAFVLTSARDRASRFRSRAMAAERARWVGSPSEARPARVIEDEQ